MIIKENQNLSFIIFDPENLKERKILEDFPGLLREGLYFFSPNKHHLVYNLYTRIRKKIKDIKYTPLVKSILEIKPDLSELPDDFIFHTEPLPHQLLALKFAYSLENIGLLLEPGLGKTKVVLDYIFLKKFRLSIIVCPKPLRFVWEHETKKHRPELKTYVIKTTDWEKELFSINSGKFNVVVVNYDKAVTLLDQLKDLKAEFLGLDEGLIKNHASDRTKALTTLSKGIGSRMIMSGTLVNNSPIDVFSPIRFIEPSLIGSGITRFKSRYAISAKFNKNVIVGFKDIPEIKSILQACSIVMTKEEWLKDLPPKTFHNILVQMSDLQREYYQKLSSNYLLQIPEKGIEIEVDNPLTLLNKLTQISNGFMYYQDNEDESLRELYGKSEKSKKKAADRKVDIFYEQPKIEALYSLINDKDKLANRRSIIWFNMSAECFILESALKKWGIKFLTIKGGEKDVGGKVELFNSDPTYRFLVCQAKTINYGVTIMGTSEVEKDDDMDDIMPEFDQLVSDEIFYSTNFSLEIFLQQQDRIHRIGQTRECNYWILVTNSSIERKIVDRLEKKLICSKEILVDILNSEKDS